MIQTPIYKFKKPELTDSPPDITATNSNWDAVEEQINDLYGEVINKKLPQPTKSMDIRSYLASLKKNEAYYVAVKQEYPLLTNIPADIQDSFSIKISGGVVHGGMYYAKVQISSLTLADSYYECSLYNNTEYSGWTKFSTTTKTDLSPNTGWSIAVECASTYVICGNILTYNALLIGDGTNRFPIQLPIPKRQDGSHKWYAGCAISQNGNSKYLTIQPDGWLNFQAGYEPHVAYAITVSYPI